MSRKYIANADKHGLDFNLLGSDYATPHAVRRAHERGISMRAVRACCVTRGIGGRQDIFAPLSSGGKAITVYHQGKRPARRFENTRSTYKHYGRHDVFPSIEVVVDNACKEWKWAFIGEEGRNVRTLNETFDCIIGVSFAPGEKIIVHIRAKGADHQLDSAKQAVLDFFDGMRHP